MLLALKCSLKTQECHEVLQKPGQGKPSLQQDLKNSKVDFPGLPIQHKPLTRLCDQLHWNNSQFYPLYTCYHLLLLTSLVLKFDPIAAQSHVSPVLKVTESYGWQELLMQVRGGGKEILWRGSPAPPPDYSQSLGKHLPASCSLLEHLNWVSRMKSNSFSTHWDFWGGCWSPFLPWHFSLEILMVIKSFAFMQQL